MQSPICRERVILSPLRIARETHIMPWWKFSTALADPVHEPDEAELPVPEDALMDTVLAFVSRLARTESLVTLVSLSNSASTLAEFVRAQGSRVTLRIRDPEVHTMKVFGPLSCALLVAVDGKNANIVMGRVIREPTLVNGRWLVLLEMGDQLLRANARRTYRVPVVEDVALLAAARGSDGVAYRVQAEDLSLGGLGGNLMDAPDGALPLGSAIQLALKCGERAVRLDAEVRFRRGSRIGLFFPGVWQREQLEAPEGLRSIFRMVELAWVRSRGDASVLGVGTAEE